MSVTLWTDYSAAGGQRVGRLVVEQGTERTRVDGNETSTLTVEKSSWLDLGGTLRQVVRIVWPEGTVSERRITQIETTDTDGTTSLQLAPIFADLSTGGPILRVVGGRVATRVAGELPLNVALSTYVTPHPAWARLGMTVGVLDKNPTVQFDLDAPTPAAFLIDVMGKAALEMEWVRTSDSVWTLNGRASRGASVAPLVVREARNQQSLALAVDDQQLATVVVPFGDADAIGERATIATARWTVAGIASGWVQLRDPDNATRTPILVDTQWTGAFVRTLTGFAQPILNARVSDGAVQLASTAGLSVGDRVSLAADATGTPLVEVYDAGSVGSQRRVVPLQLSGVRGDANELRNGRFADGLSQWTAANPITPPAFVEIPRSELGTTRTGQANGARPAATPTSTPFAVDGLPANSFVRQWAELRVGGATLAVSADTIPDIGGGITIPLSAGLPGTYPNGTPFTLVRGETRTLLLDGAQSVLLPRLRFQDSGTDGIVPVLSGIATAAVGGWVTRSLTVRYTDPVLLAGPIVMEGNPTLGALSNFLSTYTVLSNTLPSYAPGSNTATLPFTGSVGGAIVVGTTRIRYRLSNNDFFVARVTANSGGVLTLEAESHPAFGIPASSTWNGSAYAYEASETLLAAGSSWTLAIPRDTRTLLCSGTQTAGATSLVCQAQTNLTTRNWNSADTISMARSLSGTLALTGITSTTDLGPGNGMEATVTYDAAASTMDDLVFGTDWDFNQVYFNLGTVGSWRLESIGGGTAILRNGSLPFTPTPFTTPQTATATWTRTDTYALTGSASWGTNGRVTVNLASAIPAGRSYARGLAVNSNWVTGAMRLHATVSAGATSVQITGVDFFTVDSDPGASLRGAVYRIPATSSTIPIPGNTLYAASTAQANGSGQANITLTAANDNAIADNETVTIVTPELLRPSDPTTGSVVRLTSATSGPTFNATTPALASLVGVPVIVPPGTTVPVTVYVTLSLSAGFYSLSQQPVVAMVDQSGATIQTGGIASSAVTIAQTPTIVRVIATRVLTASTTVFVRIAGLNTNRTQWIAVLDAMLAIGDDDTAPFVVGSWANELAIRGAEELALRRDPAVNVTLDLATLRRWSDAPSGAPVVIGQRVQLPALGLTRRILGIDRSITDPDRVRVEVGVITDTLTDQVGQLLAGAV